MYVTQILPGLKETILGADFLQKVFFHGPSGILMYIVIISLMWGKYFPVIVAESPKYKV